MADLTSYDSFADRLYDLVRSRLAPNSGGYFLNNQYIPTGTSPPPQANDLTGVIGTRPTNMPLNADWTKYGMVPAADWAHAPSLDQSPTSGSILNQNAGRPIDQSIGAGTPINPYASSPIFQGNMVPGRDPTFPKLMTGRDALPGADMARVDKFGQMDVQPISDDVGPSIPGPYPDNQPENEPDRRPLPSEMRSGYGGGGVPFVSPANATSAADYSKAMFADADAAEAREKQQEEGAVTPPPAMAEPTDDAAQAPQAGSPEQRALTYSKAMFADADAAAKTETPPDEAVKDNRFYIPQEGMKGMLGLPSTMASGLWADTTQTAGAANWIAKKLGIPQPSDEPPVIPQPVSPDELTKAAFGGTYAPSGPFGTLAGGAARGVGSALPLLATGGLALAPTIASAAAGGVGGEVAKRATSEFTTNPWALAAADFTGNLAAGGLTAYGLGKTGAWTGFGDKPPPTQAATDAALLNRNGITVTPAIRKGLELNDKFDQTAIGQFQPLAKNVESELGPSVTPAEIGGNLANKRDAWIAGKKAESEAAFTDFEKQVAPSSSAVTHNTDKALADAIHEPAPTELGGEPLDVNPNRVDQGQAKNLPPAPKILQQLKNTMDNAEADANMGAPGSPDTTLTYNDLKAWRTRIGAELEKSKNNGGVGSGPLNSVYKGLTADMENVIEREAGPEGVDAFRKMNSDYGAAKDFVESRMGRLADPDITPEALFNNLAKNPSFSGSRLHDLYVKGVIGPDDLDAIARSHLNTLGRDTNGDWNPSSFTANARRFSSQAPEAENLLYGQRPTVETSAATASRPNSVRRITDLTNDRFAADTGNPAAGSPASRYSEMVDRPPIPLKDSSGYSNLKTVSGALDRAARNQVAEQGPGPVSQWLYKLTRGIIGSQVGKHLGGESAELLGALLMGGESHGSSATGKALYEVAKEPFFQRVMKQAVTSPRAAAALLDSEASFQPQHKDNLKTISEALRAMQ